VRPLELRVRNFRSYAGEDVAFDFRERGLVGIVGPIGSGKSSILDAIAFALYGRTPSSGHATKALINQRAESATVSLRFDVDGATWEVQRMLRKKGASQHALYRFADDEPGAEKVEQILQETPVNERIAELIGLDFDAFGRSVLLAQGRFAEFLNAPPGARDKVLKGVFGYDRVDRMRSVAKEEARRAEVEVEKAALRVQNLDDLKAQSQDRRRSRGEALERLELLEKAVPQIEELAAEDEEAVANLNGARSELDELEEIAALLPDHAEAEGLAASQATVAESRTAVAATLEEARLGAERRRAALNTLEEAGERALLEKGATLLAVRRGHASTRAAARTRLEQAVARRDEREAEVSRQQGGIPAIQKALGDTENGFEAADDTLRLAEGRYHEASHRNMAETLKLDLKVGDPCPVCAREVDDVPEGVGDPGVERARSERAEAEEGRRIAEADRTAAAGNLKAAEAALTGAEQQAEQAENAVAAARDELDVANRQLERADEQIIELLGDGEPDMTLERRRKGIDAAVEAATTAERSLERARWDHDEAIAAEQSVEAYLSDLRTRVAGAAGRLGGELSGAGSVSEDVVGVRRRFEEKRSAAEATVSRATHSIGATRKRRSELLDELGVEGQFSEELAALRARVDVLGDQIDRDDRKLAGADLVVADRDRLAARREVFAELASDLTDSRFVRFLLDDERVRLAELGSEQFQRLTGGRYRFSEDGAFDVVDLTAANAVRKASSLSGGETFLASLALALALAEMVSRSGGRLDAFFLDEGFGTLDPEHLDLAMEGVETLVAEDRSRLVVVVSHVAELRHRVEDLIELDRSPVTGTTNVVRA